MLAPLMPFGGPVAHFDGQSFLYHKKFPAFSGPDATVAFWVRWIQLPTDPESDEPQPQPQLATIFNYGEDSEGGSTHRLWLRDLTSLKVNWSGSSVDTGAKIDDSVWHHVALVLRFSDTSYGLKAYVDGIQRGEQLTLIHDRGVQLKPNREFLLGRRSPFDFTGDRFTGEISSFAVWNHEFGLPAIRSFIAFEKPQPSALEVFWQLDRNPPGIEPHGASEVDYIFNELTLILERSLIRTGNLGYFPLDGGTEAFLAEDEPGEPVTGIFTVDTSFDPVPFGPLVAMRVMDSTGRLNLQLPRASEDVDVGINRILTPNGFTFSLWIFLFPDQSATLVNRAILSPVLRLVNGRLVFTVQFNKDTPQSAKIPARVPKPSPNVGRVTEDISQIAETQPLPLGSWLHIAATYHRSINQAVVYLDGEVLSVHCPNIDESTPLISVIPFEFNVGDSNAPFNGLISRVGVYDEPVSAFGVKLLREQTQRELLATVGSDLMKRQTSAGSKKKYNEQTYLMTHNSYANAQDNWAVGTRYQFRSVTYQLEQMGVRALELDVFPFNFPEGNPKKDLYLCHGNCTDDFFGNPSGELRLFSETLKEIAVFLDKNADQVVTVFIEWGETRHDLEGNDLVRQALRTKFTDQNGKDIEIQELVFWPDDPAKYDPNNPALKVLPANVTASNVNPADGMFDWLTIEKMVSSNKRLVIFVDKNFGMDDKTPHVFPFVWQYVRETIIPEERISNLEIIPHKIYETIFERKQSQSLPNRPRQNNRALLRYNHLALASGSPTLFTNQHRMGKLLRAAKGCLVELDNNGQPVLDSNGNRIKTLDLIPNFIALDFADEGAGLKLVNRINQECWTRPTVAEAKQALLDMKLTHEEDVEDGVWRAFSH